MAARIQNRDLLFISSEGVRNANNFTDSKFLLFVKKPIFSLSQDYQTAPN